MKTMVILFKKTRKYPKEK